MRRYKGIDIGRIVFACTIPSLHIVLPESAVIYVVRQYLARLGVPFFYAVSGMFLIKNIEKEGAVTALKRYLARVGRMLIIWLIVYTPFFVRTAESYGQLIQQVLFLTPAYLWYLTGLLVASFPFCLVRNRRALYITAMVLYLFGTLFGDSYRWLIGGFPLYESVFLTMRNGVFFGLPMMCVGELVWKDNKKHILLCVVYGLLLQRK